MAVDVLINPFAARWRDIRRIVDAVEGNGFDGIWTWDHLAGTCHNAPDVLEAWTTLTAIATATSRVRVGPLVLNVANRPAGTLAVMAATLQQIAEGRLLLGLGAGGGRTTPYAREQTALGRDIGSDASRRQQVARTADELRRVWDDKASGFLSPDPPPPIVVGAFGPKMARLAGSIGDGINTQAFAPNLGELLSAARDAHAATPRATEHFVVTVFGSMDRRWLDPHRRERTVLRDLGVDRLIVLCDASTTSRDIEHAACDTRRELMNRRRLLTIDLGAKVGLVLLLLHAVVFPDLPQYAGKGLGARLLTYPISALIVPMIWFLGRRKFRSFSYPYLIDICVVAPFFIDTLGNALNLYDTINWWDDLMHFVTWVPWVVAFGLAARYRPHLRRFDVFAITAGFGAATHIVWELLEYVAFIRDNPAEFESAYKDTLGDLALSLFGSFTGAALVATVLWRLGPGGVGQAPAASVGDDVGGVGLPPEPLVPNVPAPK